MPDLKTVAVKQLEVLKSDYNVLVQQEAEIQKKKAMTEGAIHVIEKIFKDAGETTLG